MQRIRGFVARSRFAFVRARFALGCQTPIASNHVRTRTGLRTRSASPLRSAVWAFGSGPKPLSLFRTPDTCRVVSLDRGRIGECHVEFGCVAPHLPAFGALEMHLPGIRVINHG